MTFDYEFDADEVHYSKAGSFKVGEHVAGALHRQIVRRIRAEIKGNTLAFRVIFDSPNGEFSKCARDYLCNGEWIVMKKVTE